MTTKKLVMQAVVPTNAIKGSVCRIEVQAVKFADLWDAYVTGNPFPVMSSGLVGRPQNGCLLSHEPI